MSWLSELLHKWSCHHDWEEFKTFNWFESSEDTRPYKKVYLLKCKKCGKFKKLKIS